MTIQISLTKGQIAIVDDCDVDLAQLNWQARTRKWTNYAVRSGRAMHRIILERKMGRPLLASEVTDHADGNGLNNTRDNLRVATARQNMQNANKNGGKQGLKGVRVDRNGRHSALIRIEGKRIYLGAYASALDAHKAYCIAALTHHKEYANFGSNSPFTKEELIGVEIHPLPRWIRLASLSKAATAPDKRLLSPREMAVKAYEETGSIRKAAKSLGVSRSAVHGHIKKHRAETEPLVTQPALLPPRVDPNDPRYSNLIIATQLRLRGTDAQEQTRAA